MPPFARLFSISASIAVVTVATVVTGALSPYSAHAQTSFTPLGDLPGSGFSSQPFGVSGDGKTVVGDSYSTIGSEAFRWTSGSGMTGLGNLSPFFTQTTAYGVSGDGSAITGKGYYPINSGNPRTQAFRWTASTGLVALGYLPPNPNVNLQTSVAYGISSNGAVVVGQSYGVNSYEAFRWTSATAMVGLGDLPGGTLTSEARGVSGDGLVVVGNSSSATSTSSDNAEAFRWTAQTGMVGLGYLPGSFPFFSTSQATGVSVDGTTIVGRSTSLASGGAYEAFRWTTASGMVGLGDLPGGSFNSEALGVSADGSVIVGSSDVGSGSAAFLWTAMTGMVNLKEYLLTNAPAGSLPSDFSAWRLATATSVSADGSVITGTGSDPNGRYQGWRVAISVPEPGSVFLLGVGLLPLLGFVWRRHRSSIAR